MFIEYNAQQLREYQNSAQKFEAMDELAQLQRSQRGSMIFQKSRGQEYLTRFQYGDDGKRFATTLGRRSPETERTKAEFDKARSSLNSRLKSMNKAFEQQAALNRAVGINRLPLLPAKIIRAFQKSGYGPERLRIVGTHALYAYEAMGRVLFEGDLTITEDIDFLIDPRAALRVVLDDDFEDSRMITILRRVDRSFDITNRSYRAVNDKNFIVDIIRPPGDMRTDSELQTRWENDLQPSPIEGLEWLVNAPVTNQLVIDAKGWPLIMSVPDPRVFAIHKLWIAQSPQRKLAKDENDERHAEAVAKLLAGRLQHMPFDRRKLRMLPRDVVNAAMQKIKPR